MRYDKTKIKTLAVLAALALVLAWAAPGAAKKPPKAEQKAARLWSKIKSHLDGNRELEACRAAVKMAPYQGTKAYAAAKKALRARAISIEDPLLSWTSKAMIRAQNVVERDLLVKGDLKHIGVLPEHKDAWGTPLRVEMVEMGEYLYMVRSAGPDRKYATNDDPIIGGLKPKELKQGSGSGRKVGGSSAGRAKKGGKTDTTLKGLLNQGGGSAGTGAGGGGPEAEPEMDEEPRHQEEVVELDDLIQKTE